MISTKGDFFSTGTPVVLLAALLLPFLVLSMALAIGCWSIEYGVPPADTYSFPLPKLPKS